MKFVLCKLGLKEKAKVLSSSERPFVFHKGKQHFLFTFILIGNSQALTQIDFPGRLTLSETAGHG